MRHASIETTMKYYVGLDANKLADAVWREDGDQSGDTPTKPIQMPQERESRKS
jgi:hypothetical protein